MPLGGPGPRDWTPSSTPTRSSRRTSTATVERSRTRPGGLALLSVLLGCAALAVGVAQPTGSGASHGFLVSTIGITAVLSGRAAVRQARWGRPATRAFGRLGAIFGGVGTGLMAYALLAYLIAPTGVALPPLSIAAYGMSNVASSINGLPVPGVGGAVAPAPAIASTAPQATTPAAPQNSSTDADPDAVAMYSPTTASEEKDSIWTSVGSLAYVMKQDFSGGPYPVELGTASSSPERILLPSGTALSWAPNGAHVLYSRSSDGMSYSVTIIGASFGQRATFDSTLDVIK